MELPPLLRNAVDRALSGMPLSELATTAAVLSQRYREGRRDGKAHVASDRDALAYLAVRLPARASPRSLRRARILRRRLRSILALVRAPRSGQQLTAGPLSPRHCWSKQARFFVHSESN
jgi:hypothetical protein